MLTEREVREQVREIVDREDRPMSKVRRLLRLARDLENRARALIHARALSVQVIDLKTAAHMDRLARGLRMLYEEVRWTARRVAQSVSPLSGELSLA